MQVQGHTIKRWLVQQQQQLGHHVDAEEGEGVLDMSGQVWCARAWSRAHSPRAPAAPSAASPAAAPGSPRSRRAAPEAGRSCAGSAPPVMPEMYSKFRRLIPPVKEHSPHPCHHGVEPAALFVGTAAKPCIQALQAALPGPGAATQCGLRKRWLCRTPRAARWEQAHGEALERLGARREEDEVHPLLMRPLLPAAPGRRLPFAALQHGRIPVCFRKAASAVIRCMPPLLCSTLLPTLHAVRDHAACQ